MGANHLATVIESGACPALQKLWIANNSDSIKHHAVDERIDKALAARRYKGKKKPKSAMKVGGGKRTKGKGKGKGCAASTSKAVGGGGGDGGGGGGGGRTIHISDRSLNIPQSWVLPP